MKPTREQVIRWAAKCGLYWTLKTETDILNMIDFAQLAFESGQDSMREDADEPWHMAMIGMSAPEGMKHDS